MRPGDHACLRSGTYTGTVSLHLSGTPGAPITFAACAGESPLLLNPAAAAGRDTVSVYGAYLVLDGLRVTNRHQPGSGVAIAAGAHDVTVKNGEMFGNAGQGIIIAGDRCLIEGNRVHDNGVRRALDHGIYVAGRGNVIRGNAVWSNFAYGIQLYAGPGRAGGATVVEGNYVYHNGYGSTALGSYYNAGVIVAEGQPHSVIRYNRICDNAQYGIYANDAVPGTRIVNNVTCFNGRAAVLMDVPGPDNVLRGNLSFRDAAAFGAGAALASDHNVFWAGGAREPRFRWKGAEVGLSGWRSATGQDRSSRVVDPRFARLPDTRFEPSEASTYDFCTPLLPGLCRLAGPR